MSENSNPQSQTTGSGISVDKNTSNVEVTGTVTLSRQSIGRPSAGQPPPPEKTAPPPQSEVSKMPYSVASDKDIACAKCGDKFDISPDFYNTVTECPSCKCVFVIRPPGTAPYKPPAGAPAPAAPAAAPAADKPTTSGIQVEQKTAKDYGITGTVLLSRQGMSMNQRKRGQRRAAQQQERTSSAMPAPPPSTQVQGMTYSVATENDVGCPKCQERFEISPEFYEQVAECPECSVEFVIKPPGTPPYQGAVAQAMPTAPLAATPTPVTTPAPAVAPAVPAAAPVAPAQPVAETTPTPSTGEKKMNPMIIGLAAAIVLLLVVLIVVIALK